MSQETRYLVELETGVAYGAKDHRVFTGGTWCKDIRDARSVAKKMMYENPSLCVRIKRKVTSINVFATFPPNVEVTGPASGSGPTTGWAMIKP